MKKYIYTLLICFAFVGCGTVSLPTPVSNSTITPTESCN